MTDTDLDRLNATYWRERAQTAEATVDAAHEAVPDTVGNPSTDSVAHRIELLVEQSEARIAELEAEVTRRRNTSEAFAQRDQLAAAWEAVPENFRPADGCNLAAAIGHLAAALLQADLSVEALRDRVIRAEDEDEVGRVQSLLDSMDRVGWTHTTPVEHGNYHSRWISGHCPMCAEREQIAASLEKRAARMDRVAADRHAPLGNWFANMQTAQWLRELADEVRAGVL